jgi:hypothetical protein
MYIPGVTNEMAIALAKTPIFKNIPVGERL